MNKIFKQNPNIDFLFGEFEGLEIPTKQLGFESVPVEIIDNDGQEISKRFYTDKPDTESVKQYKKLIGSIAARIFNDSSIIRRPNHVEVIISASMTDGFLTKDVDNIAKVVLDSLIGIAFEDDSQVTALIINKHIHPMKKNGVLIGITKLTEDKLGFASKIKLFYE
jgi:Holliday junction resolvase RusA-like endonuclease